MKISLVIPVHNLEKYIEPLLVSLKYQAFDHNEIEPIFICDSCEDNTHAIIENALADSFPHLVIIDREYKSSGLSRNDGLERATGELIWLLDGDDWLIDNHAIFKVVSYFQQNPDKNALHVDWASNMFTNKSYLFTVWQWVLKADWAKAVKFTSRKYDDDVEWVRNWMIHWEYTGGDTLTDPLYFYNYMREGSVMFVRALENSKGENHDE